MNNPLRQAVHKKDPLSRAESLIKLIKLEKQVEVALLPTEANFQIPDTFLSTKLLPECETYFIQGAKEMTEAEIEEWNMKIDRTLEEIGVEINLAETTPTRKTVTEEELKERIVQVLQYDKR